MRRHIQNAESREDGNLRHGRFRRHLREDGAVAADTRHQHRRAFKAHRRRQEEAVVCSARAEGDEGGLVSEALHGLESGSEELREPEDGRGDREEGLSR